ncbi:MAG TPA: bacteriohemerythrin [Nitrospirota bacterium]|nr:bacteriohemerythrin [Nitrospirota bacterium]
MQWNDNLSSGAQIIDTQHQELIGRVNRLLDAFQQGAVARQEVSSIIQYLADYVVFHFGTEENYMAVYNYPSMSNHKAQHEQFVRTFLRMKDRIMIEGINASLAEDARQVVVDWLVNHIKYSDRALGMYLKMKM